VREYELVIDEALKKGLSPEKAMIFNSPYLQRCLGFRCNRSNLEAAIEGSNPLAGEVAFYYDWPFPQFITGNGYNILVIRESTVNLEDIIYEVSEDLGTVTHMFSIDELTFGVGTMMEAADFGDYLFMTNGVVMIYRNTVTDTWVAATTHANIPMMRTICNFKGQAVGGNIVSAWHDCNERYYVWSKIGSMDFTPDDMNTAGYRRCPYGGIVRNVKRLGDSVIGYSSKGITGISPVSQPAPTFGFTELDDTGIINQGAVDGDLYRHVYVGTDLIVRQITKEGIKELGYEKWMDEIDNEDIIVKFDKANKDFYIGNSKKTFLLSPYGMTEVRQHPSALWREDEDEAYMIPETVDLDLPLITTEVIDMGYKGQKTISVIETDAMIVEDPEAAVDWANDLTTWGYGSFTPINNMGIASITASGNAFAVSLRFGDIYPITTIGYIKARYKMTDLRGIRGVYAPPLRGQ